MPTASQWELYTPRDADARMSRTETVRALNAALKVAKAELRQRLRAAIKAGELPGYRDGRRFEFDAFGTVDGRRGYAIVGRMISDVQYRNVDVVRYENRHAYHGAADTEPGVTAMLELRAVAAKVLGISARDL